MPRVHWPAQPQVESGTVFSAAMLRYAHGAAISWLHGESHASYPLPHVRPPSTDVFQADYQTIWTLWGIHASQVAYYRLRVKINYGNDIHRAWAYRIQVSPDNGATWYTAREMWDTNNTYQLEEGTIDLTAVSDGGGGHIADHLTVGRLYKWRLQVRVAVQGDPADCTVHCEPWSIGTRKSVAAGDGWLTPPTFAAGVSNPAHLNTLAHDAHALEHALPPGEASTSWPAKHTITFSETWEELTRVAYRYRPNMLYVVVLGSAWADETWQWRVKVETDTASAVVYTSDPIAGNEALEIEDYSWTNAAMIDLTSGDAAAALSGAGITLTLGDWYRVAVEIYTTASPGRAWAVGAAVQRTSNQAPGAGYTVPHLWQVGDTDIGPTHLNALSASLTALYSGAEALHYDAAGVDVVANGSGHALAHRRRYLRYVAPEQPRIHYGPDQSQTYDPPASATPAPVDLDAVGVPYGSIYYVTGCETAMEADSE
jgi:hypothetical protein